MAEETTFYVLLLKPSKYAADGHVERFRKGFMPNSTLLHLKSMTPLELNGRRIHVETIDEYTKTDLGYLRLLSPKTCSLLAVVGVQSHQIQRAIDIAALARTNGVRNCIIGGPHAMTCDTSDLHGHGVSFALAEAELIWPSVLQDAMEGNLQRVYGEEQRWQTELSSQVLVPPNPADLRSYLIPMVGIYPARGCPYSCNFCSVVKIAGKQVRGQSVDITIRSLLAAQEAGVRLVMFTSDNFNKYTDARPLLEGMIEQGIRLPFFVQCDVQLGQDEAFIELLARAGCAQVFIGVESLDRQTLKAARKFQNDPGRYAELVRVCHKKGVTTHFSNIIGFPDQNEAAILKHVRNLRSLGPFMASFYILTPIPGTDQYDDFLGGGLIVEKNLDRFDATCAVWQHPHLTAEQLEALLFRAYRDFYDPYDVVAKMFGHDWNAPWFVHALGLGYAGVARLSAFRRMHPMAGGICRVKIDKVDDYIHLRRF